MTEPWILCVDDEPKILEGLELQLSFDHDVRTAESGPAGLETLQAHPGCAVIISDMRMPAMNGAQFLAAARDVAPDATRMLLTGYSEMSDAIAAINEGGIFRFLTKPTPPDAMKKAVDDGLRQWELIQSERVLLEQTLHGAAEALVEALEIASPAAFSRARRIESACRHAAVELGQEPVWEIALAGLLVRLGWIALPDDIITKYLAGRELTATEQVMLDRAYGTGVRLVGRIPRLDGVAKIIGDAGQPSGDVDPGTIVRTVAEFDQLCNLGQPGAKAIKTLEGKHPTEILVALSSWDGANGSSEIHEVRLTGLTAGMVVEKDILTLDGNLLVTAGTDLTETVIQRLDNFSTGRGVREPITVSITAR